MDQPIHYPEPPADLGRGFSWRNLKYFGAGAIIASVTIGSGETLFASRGGAIFGYSLLWCFVAGAFLKGIQVYTAARYITLTGEHPMTHWGVIPGPRNWVPIAMGAMSLICFPFWLSGLPLLLGDMINWVSQAIGSNEELLFKKRVWGTIAIVVFVTITWIHTYGVLERVQLVIVGTLLLSVLVAVFAAQPDWLAALTGAITPVIPSDYEPWVHEAYADIAMRPPWIEIVAALGAIGGGTYDYLGYIGCYREKGWGALGLRDSKFAVHVKSAVSTLPIDTSPKNLSRARRWLAAPMIDTTFAFAAVLVFTACFLILGAVVLHPQHLVPSGNELMNHQAQFLTNIHPSLRIVYVLGVFGAIGGTLYGAYEIYIRTAFECLMPVSARMRKLEFRKFRVGVLLYCGIFGMVLLWTMTNPVAMVTPAAILGGVFACGLWCFAMMWTDRRFLPRPLQMGRLLFGATAVAGTFLTLMGAKAIVDYVADLLK